MRNSLLVGSALTLTAVAVVLVSGTLDLDLEPVALLGLAAGATIALSGDRTVGTRIAAFLAGVGIAWIGYVVRALALPDATSGRVVGLAIVVALVALLAVATSGRLPLWAGLLGAGVFAGAYDRVYTAAPAELATTSVEALSALLLTVAAGLLAGILTRPVPAPARAEAEVEVEVQATTVPAQPAARRDRDEVELDELMAS